jgi:hypothetical protein
MNIEVGTQVAVEGTWLGERGEVVEVAEQADPTLYLVQDATGYTEWCPARALNAIDTTREGK